MTDRRLIAKRYLRTWFAFDAISCIPFDLIGRLYLSRTPGAEKLQLLAFLKTPRLLRLSRLLRFLDKMKGSQYFKLLKLTFLIIMIAHWVACGYCLLASLEDAGPTWVEISVRRGGWTPGRGDALAVPARPVVCRCAATSRRLRLRRLVPRHHVLPSVLNTGICC